MRRSGSPPVNHNAPDCFGLRESPGPHSRGLAWTVLVTGVGDPSVLTRGGDEVQRMIAERSVVLAHGSCL
jgi:hypothetical protein